MKNFDKLIVVSLISCLLSSCAVLFPQKPKLTKRYKEITYSNLPPNNYVKVTGFVTKSASNSPKSIFDLSERGQKALIDAIGELEKDPSKIVSHIAAPIKESKPAGFVVDHSIIKKRIVLSIADVANLKGANRLQYIKVNLKIPNGNTNYSLVSWDKIVTIYQDIDIGKLTFNQTDTSTLGAEINLSGTVKGALSSSFTNTDVLNEELQLTRRFPRLTGSITDKEMVLHRRSTALESMDGNVIIDVTFKLASHPERPAYTFEGLFDSQGQPVRDISKISISQRLHILPSVTNVNLTSIDMSYYIEYRKVVKGYETYVESDDEIVLNYSNTGYASFVNLCDENDLNINLWTLKLNGNPVYIKQGNQRTTLAFDSYIKALNFLKWLKLTGIVQFPNSGVYALQNLAGTTLVPSNINSLVISLL